MNTEKPVAFIDSHDMLYLPSDLSAKIRTGKPLYLASPDVDETLRQQLDSAVALLQRVQLSGFNYTFNAPLNYEVNKFLKSYKK